MKIENPVGVSGLWLAFLIALLNLVAFATELSAQFTQLTSIVLAAFVAAVSETIRRK
jgi:hypothetical protein